MVAERRRSRRRRLAGTIHARTLAPARCGLAKGSSAYLTASRYRAAVTRFRQTFIGTNLFPAGIALFFSEAS